MFENILLLYGLNPNATKIAPFGNGLINHTWKVTTDKKNFILQRINTGVFKDPGSIDRNISLIKEYIAASHPGYLFVSPLNSVGGNTLIHEESGYYRLFPFIEGSFSLSSLTQDKEAYQASRQFGKFTRILADFDAERLNITIPDFHNLELRYHQFLEACNNAAENRLKHAFEAINFINEQKEIVEIYNNIRKNEEMPLRVIHHDTKISNVLFDRAKKGLCVIDLDTVMPGYYISDVGDMMRTYLAEASEEETDFSKIKIRKNFYKAIYEGYMSLMDDVLTETEKRYFAYSGKFIIYMQAIRFLTDYLMNDVYYGSKYDRHNLNRAFNQITLLKEYLKLEKQML